MLDLTIAIPVKNEAKNLPRCLQEIGRDFAKHIVVIDSGSTDETTMIASEFGAEVLHFDWNGKFPKKRNWYLRNHPPVSKWILFLDADEYITSDFKNEVCKKLDNEGALGYWLSYSTYFLGKKLNGGYPLRKLALFQVGAGEYEQIEEDHWSGLDMEVHEHPILKGKIGIIRSKIDHQDFRGVNNFILKHNEYSSWEAGRFLRVSEWKPLGMWTWRQWLKYRLMKSIFFPPAFFCGSFFLYGGFKDGRVGLLHAFLRMSYYVQTYCKIQEALKQQRLSKQSINKDVKRGRKEPAVVKVNSSPEASKIV